MAKNKSSLKENIKLARERVDKAREKMTDNKFDLVDIRAYNTELVKLSDLIEKNKYRANGLKTRRYMDECSIHGIIIP